MNKKSVYPIHHHTLPNGLNVIIQPDAKVPNVSIQLWYNVGSKDEQAGEKGLAHLLEHMIFKGTKRMSESDINVITHKLAGYTNAFTSYDYTGYLFDFSKAHWQVALDMLADCMQGCTFKEDLLQSELKAVIQELKMYKDDYESCLVEGLTSAIFSDHPYHHPIIGYKQDLWSITHEGLMAFYKKHYVPNNATLVVVGDVDPAQALKDIEHYFGHLAPNHAYTRPTFYAHEDVHRKSLTLHRDVQRPLLMYAWRVPGIATKKDFYVRVLAQIIAQGEGSRLYRRLVDELQLATDVGMFLDDLFEQGILFLAIDPIDVDAMAQIEQVVQQELERCAQEGFAPHEVQRGMKQVAMEQLVMHEKQQERAYAIGRSFLATGDSKAINSYTNDDQQAVAQEVAALCARWLRPTLMHTGMVLPLKESEREHWLAIQKESDETDQVILARKVRSSDIEAPVYAQTVEKKEVPPFEVMQHQVLTLENGLRILHGYDPISQKVELVLSFEMAADAEPDDKLGLSRFVFALLQEGTKQHNKADFIQLVESHGMRLDVDAGQIHITVLKEDVALGMQLLFEMIEHALFNDEAIAKVRAQLLAEVDDFWDEPFNIGLQLAREHVYQGHPWAKQNVGTKQTINAITKDDLLTYYQAYVQPRNARLACVGNLTLAEIEQCAQTYLAQWTPADTPQPLYPSILVPQAKEMVHPINRDQVVLAFAGLSVPRTDANYDALLLFDQIFTGGSSGSMNSRLFALREQTGLFYTIGGSLVYAAGKQPGMHYIRTIVSVDRLKEAEEAIKRTCMQAMQGLSQEELVAAKDMLKQSIVDQFSLQQGAAKTFLFLDTLGLPADYYARRADALQAIEAAQVNEAVRSLFDADKLSTFKVGRL